MAPWTGNDPALTCLKDRALDHSCSTANFGATDGNRTRMNSVDSGVPCQSASVANPQNAKHETPNTKVVRAGGFEPPSLSVRSRVSCPVERRPHKEPGTGTRHRTWNLLLQRQPLCQLSYPGMAGSGRIERPQRPSKGRGLPLTELPKWGDRRESNSRRLVHSQPPEPLGYGHIWRPESESNAHCWLFKPAP
jgi:hypothetical protein